eukprot:CAMPEP_0119006584 /NCGR_PEP_ID=MMETSP1176-20130426/2390_1 /TAXON_ID=265551 /ORGANISM="Synedropsis recta cf, Strain CCMP1620" /LENGTH=46 /DNA_ID= /DNA_START= /DNA_END= /DNA_ORIENTATION=
MNSTIDGDERAESADMGHANANLGDIREELEQLEGAEFEIEEFFEE